MNINLKKVLISLAFLFALLPFNGSLAADYYTNVYGNKISSPSKVQIAPKGASARCRDGTYSFSASRRGTCSHHGGVSKWL